MLANFSATACDSVRIHEMHDTYAAKVRFDDLNLDRQAGAETLYKRLESAARRVCGPREAGSAYLHHLRDWE